jgi:hypothetical protein
MKRTALLALACLCTVAVHAQNPPAQPGALPVRQPIARSERKWLRTTPFQTYSNVKGGANEFQNDIVAGASRSESRHGSQVLEPVFTPAGKAAFDHNIRVYGLRTHRAEGRERPAGQLRPVGRAANVERPGGGPARRMERPADGRQVHQFSG